MNIDVRLLGQLGQAAGGPRHAREASPGTTAQDLVRSLCAELDAPFRSMVLDDTDQLRPFVLLYVGEQPVPWNEPRPLQDGDRVLLATPIAGG